MIEPVINEKTTNKALVKFYQSKFENHIPTKRYSLLSTELSLQQARLMLASRRLKKNISDNFNAISIDRFSSKLKLGKTHGTSITLFCVSLICLQLQRVCSPH